MPSSEWAILGSVVLVHALAVASPGPDFAMVVRQAVAGGRGAGLWTAAGIGSGILFHVAYGLFGLAWLTARFPQLLQIVGLAGGLFLAYMGVQALRAKPHPAGAATPAAPRPSSWRRDYLIGLLTNVLNPKATLFFVAVFTAVVTGPMSVPMQLALALWLPLSTFAWFASVSLLLSHPRLRQRLGEAAHWIERAMGGLLVALGLVTLANALAGG